MNKHFKEQISNCNAKKKWLSPFLFAIAIAYLLFEMFIQMVSLVGFKMIKYIYQLQLIKKMIPQIIVQEGKGDHFSLWRETGLIWDLFLEV